MPSLPRRALRFLAVTALLSAVAPARADNWPNWRGPLNNGLSAEKNLPTEFRKDGNLAWRTELPGPGGSTPVVWGDRVFLTAVTGSGDLLTLGYSTSGKELWRAKVSGGNKDVRGDEGNSASNSPVTDGAHVWSMMADGRLACHTVDGKEAWAVDLQERYGKFDIQFGLTSTPVLDHGRLYLQLIHGTWNKEPSRGVVACLDAATGREVWKQMRETDAVDENKHSYASPMLYDHDGKRFLLSHGADYIIAHALDTGAELWRCGDLNIKSKYDPTLRLVASPACADGLIVVPTAKGGPVLALGPHGKGDITASTTDRLWNYTRTPDVPSPVIHDGLVYLCMQDGDLYCLDQKTGAELYKERTHRQRHRASPVLAGGHLYLTARDGIVTVVKAGPKFEKVSENDLGESIAASPAVSNGTVYFRTFNALWAFRK